jgi:hypothetical protein
MRIFAGGPRDLDDVRGVLKNSRDSINVDEVRRLSSCYGSHERSLLETLLAES